MNPLQHIAEELTTIAAELKLGERDEDNPFYMLGVLEAELRPIAGIVDRIEAIHDKVNRCYDAVTEPEIEDLLEELDRSTFDYQEFVRELGEVRGFAAYYSTHQKNLSKRISDAVHGLGEALKAQSAAHREALYAENERVWGEARKMYLK